MLDLVANLPVALGVIAAIVVAFFGNTIFQRRKGRKEGKKDAIEEWKNADNAEADAIRRRADDARGVRDDSGRGFRD